MYLSSEVGASDRGSLVCGVGAMLRFDNSKKENIQQETHVDCTIHIAESFRVSVDDVIYVGKKRYGS